MNYPNFDKAYQRGENAENEILEIVKKKYPRAYRVKGYFKEYDIYVPETNDKIEVKRDRRAIETGNYFVETMYDDKPSGISTTKATFYVWVDNELIVWAPTEVLRNMIRNKKEIIFKANGDKSRGGVVIKRDSLIYNPYTAYFKRNV